MQPINNSSKTIPNQDKQIELNDKEKEDVTLDLTKYAKLLILSKDLDNLEERLKNVK